MTPCAGWELMSPDRGAKVLTGAALTAWILLTAAPPAEAAADAESRVDGAPQTLDISEALRTALRFNPTLLAAQESIPQAKVSRDRAFALISPTARVGASWRLNDREIGFDFADEFGGDALGDAFGTVYSNLGVVYETLFEQELLSAADCDQIAVINGYADCAGLTEALVNSEGITAPSQDDTEDNESTETIIQPKQQGFLTAELNWTLSPRVVTMGRAGAAQLQAARLELRSNQAQLVLQVVEAYGRAYQAQQSLQVVETQAELAAAHVADTQLLRDAGVVTEDAVLRARLELARLQGQLSDLQRRLSATTRALALAMGSKLAAQTALAPLPAIPITDPEDDSDWISDALNARPDAAAAQARARAAEHIAADAALQFLPSFSVTGALNWTDQPAGFDSQQTSWWLGVGASLPLWDGGLLVQNAREAASRKRQARRRSEAVQEQIAASIADARDGWRAAREAVPIAELERDLALESHRLLGLRYGAGEARQLELLDGRAVLQAAELSLLQRRLDLQIAAVRLLASLGALNQWLEPLLEAGDSSEQ
ncbi:MAG TPA: hypothetical protein DIU15_01240 [Deltaproteobacteria bacterium]|nr:hypothetical protein [Deltaproteobacteria bacterium]